METSSSWVGRLHAVQKLTQAPFLRECLYSVWQQEAGGGIQILSSISMDEVSPKGGKTLNLQMGEVDVGS